MSKIGIPSPQQQIVDAAVALRVASERAETAAVSLRTLVLAHRTGLVSQSAILAEAATLLCHVSQHFERVASKPVEP